MTRNIKIIDCDVTLHDDYDAILYKRFHDAFIVNAHCVSCDVHNDHVIATMHYDDDDDVCTIHDDGYAYDDTNIYVFIDNRFVMA